MLFTSRNELIIFFLVQTWTPAWAPAPVCSTDLDPWLGSWSCVGLKDAVRKQK